MSRYKFAEIHCDIRDIMSKVESGREHEDYFQPGHQGMALAIKQARTAGWVRTKIHNEFYDFCPACAKFLHDDMDRLNR